MAVNTAELVDVAEQVYRQVFAVGLWVVAALSTFSACASLLQPTGQSRLVGLVVCGTVAVTAAVTARRPAELYTALSRRPSLLLAAGLCLGLGAWQVGIYNLQLFVPIIAVVGVAGIPTSPRIIAASALIAGAGLGAPQVIDGAGNLGAALVVIVPPLLFWLIVDRIAGFALRLHQSLRSLGTAIEANAGTGAADAETSPSGNRRQISRRWQRLLPAPRTKEIDVHGARLTTRQLQVVMLLCEGLTQREAARCLEISAAQVGRHLAKARAQVGVATNAQLVAWALRVGVVPGAD